MPPRSQASGLREFLTNKLCSLVFWFKRKYCQSQPKLQFINLGNTAIKVDKLVTLVAELTMVVKSDPTNMGLNISPRKCWLVG